MSHSVGFWLYNNHVESHQDKDPHKRRQQAEDHNPERRLQLGRRLTPVSNLQIPRPPTWPMPKDLETVVKRLMKKNPYLTRDMAEAEARRWQ